MSEPRFNIYAPIQDFSCDASEFEICPGLSITQQRPDLRGREAKLGEIEQIELSRVQHWLTFQSDEKAKPSAAEIVNLVLLALWLVRPTKAHVRYRFKFGASAAADSEGTSRLLDAFRWIEGAAVNEFTKRNLQLVASYYPIMHSFCCGRGRLNDALLLTLAACCSHWWHVALICHAAAAETLLNYGKGREITRRLATSYACIVEEEKVQRDLAFCEFSKLYDIRSDIMHGRTNPVRKADRLPIVARFGKVMRNLWKAVILDHDLAKALADTDAKRKAFLCSAESGYAPPQPSSRRAS